MPRGRYDLKEAECRLARQTRARESINALRVISYFVKKMRKRRAARRELEHPERAVSFEVGRSSLVPPRAPPSYHPVALPRTTPRPSLLLTMPSSRVWQVVRSTSFLADKKPSPHKERTCGGGILGFGAGAFWANLLCVSSRGPSPAR